MVNDHKVAPLIKYKKNRKAPNFFYKFKRVNVQARRHRLRASRPNLAQLQQSGHQTTRPRGFATLELHRATLRLHGSTLSSQVSSENGQSVDPRSAESVYASDLALMLHYRNKTGHMRRTYLLL